MMNNDGGISTGTNYPGGIQEYNRTILRKIRKKYEKRNCGQKIGK